MLVKDLIAQFAAYHQEHSSPATQRFYRHGLAWFLAGFGECEWAALDRLRVLAALQAANTDPRTGASWAPDTIRRNKTAINQLQRWAVDQEMLTEAQLCLKKRDLKKPMGRRRERIPTEAELQAILDAAPPEVRAALLGLARTGMRPGELCKATIEMIDGRTIVIKEHKTSRKVSKARRIPIGRKLAPVVDPLIAGRESGPIWRDARGKAWTSASLSRQFARLRDALGLTPELKLYCLRHYVGTVVTRHKGIAAAQHVLGHADPSTTARYNHPDDEDARDAQDAV